MEIDKNISINNSIHSKSDSILKKDKKIKAESKLDSNKESTLIQLSDYIHLQEKSAQSKKTELTSLINDVDEASAVLEAFKSKILQSTTDFISTQANSHPKTVYYLLG